MELPAEIVQPLIQAVLVTAIAVIAAVITRLGNELVRLIAQARPAIVHAVNVHAGGQIADQLDEVFGIAVRAAHDARKTGIVESTGNMVLAYAIRLAHEEGLRRGYDLDPETLDRGVRAKYQEQKYMLEEPMQLEHYLGNLPPQEILPLKL